MRPEHENKVRYEGCKHKFIKYPCEKDIDVIV